jgi:hypothetical protein
MLSFDKHVPEHHKCTHSNLDNNIVKRGRGRPKSVVVRTPIPLSMSEGGKDKRGRGRPSKHNLKGIPLLIV